MKKILFFVAGAALFASCSGGAMLAKPVTNTVITSASHSNGEAPKIVAAVFADLNVSPTRITHVYLPPKTIALSGEENIVNSAVRDALSQVGGDVIIALEKQVKYGPTGEIQSVIITGYPATYVNFRNPGDDYLKQVGASSEQPVVEGTAKKSLLPF
jgi:hypothetical protein